MTQFFPSKQFSVTLPLAVAAAFSFSAPAQASLITLNVSGKVYQTTFPTVAIGDAFHMSVQYDDAVFPHIVDEDPNPAFGFYDYLSLGGELQIGDDPVQSLANGYAMVFTSGHMILNNYSSPANSLVEYLFTPGTPLADDSLSGAFQAAITGQIFHPNRILVSYGDGNGIFYKADISNINSSLSYNTVTPPTNVPLPASTILFSSALAMFGVTGKRRRKPINL